MLERKLKKKTVNEDETYELYPVNSVAQHTALPTQQNHTVATVQEVKVRRETAHLGGPLQEPLPKHEAFQPGRLSPGTVPGDPIWTLDTHQTQSSGLSAASPAPGMA